MTSVVASSARIGSGARLEDSIIMDDAFIGAGSVLRIVIVGPGCMLPRGTVLDGARPGVVGTRTDGGVLVVSKGDVPARTKPGPMCAHDARRVARAIAMRDGFRS